MELNIVSIFNSFFNFSKELSKKFRFLDLEKILFKIVFSYLAGALGFEPRMAVPKTAALPLGYAPKLISYIINKKNYIVFDLIHQ